METLERLAALADKSKSKWTAKDREYIVDLCAEHGIRLNTLCPDCYKDAAIELYTKLKPSDAEPKSAGGYALRPGTDIFLHARNGNTYHVCEALLNAKSAREWLKNGLSESYFVSVPK